MRPVGHFQLRTSTYCGFSYYSNMLCIFLLHIHTHTQTHIHLFGKASLDVMRDHPLHRTHFDQYQLCWGDREMGTAISCTRCSQVAGLSHSLGHTRTHTHTHTHTHACTRTYTHTHHTYTHVHTHTHTHMHTHVHAHTRTRTHMYTQSQQLPHSCTHYY